MKTYSTPHFEKLKALLDNSKLPVNDKPRVTEAMDIYETWINNLRQAIISQVTSEQMFNTLYLENNPFRIEVFQHLINNIRNLLNNEGLDESNVLEVGYF